MKRNRARRRWSRRIVLAGLLAGGLAGRPAGADETTYCNTFITALPYTIATQGHYCLDRNLATAITSGAAITIASDFVVLDLNHFKLGGGAAGPGTKAVGVYAIDRSNVTVRNGNIRGFAYGILLTSTVPEELVATGIPQNVLVEGNTLDGNTVSGISVFARPFTIRDNTVANTGGTTLVPVPNCDQKTTGIQTVQVATPDAPVCGPDRPGLIANNAVSTTNGPMATRTVAIDAPSSSLDENRVIGVTGGTAHSFVGRVCRQNLGLHAQGFACEHNLGTLSLD